MIEDPLARRPDLVWISPEVELFGWGEALRVDLGTGPERFSRAWETWRCHAPGLPVPVAFTSFTFDDRSVGSVLLSPETLAARRGDRWEIRGDPTCIPPPRQGQPPTDRPRYAGSSVPDLVWMEAVSKALEMIQGGGLAKVVLARDYGVWSKRRFDPHRVLGRLRDRFPECFVFLMDGLAGASPELLVRLEGTEVESVPLAGSAPRAPDPEDDDRLGRTLLSSDKESREHRLAADSVEEVLERLCGVLEREPPKLLKLANVQHIATRFRGRLASSASVVEVAGSLHPTAAVGGVPRERALDVIRELEGMDRGRYAGPVGWMDDRGDGEFAVALRCAELSGARARLFAGAGLVAGSLPEAELEETRLKLEAMLSALA